MKTSRNFKEKKIMADDSFLGCCECSAYHKLPSKTPFVFMKPQEGKNIYFGSKDNLLMQIIIQNKKSPQSYTLLNLAQTITHYSVGWILNLNI